MSEVGSGLFVHKIDKIFGLNMAGLNAKGLNYPWRNYILTGLCHFK